jgi:hypothetical protein
MSIYTLLTGGSVALAILASYLYLNHYSTVTTRNQMSKIKNERYELKLIEHKLLNHINGQDDNNCSTLNEDEIMKLLHRLDEMKVEDINKRFRINLINKLTEL